MWAFLEHSAYWARATSILHAENIPDAFWKSRNDLQQVKPDIGSESVERLADALSEYFHAREGRGRHCKVDVFRRRGCEYFFAYLSNFGQSDLEWHGSTLSPRARNPAFEIIFAFNQAEGKLDIYAPRNSKYVDDLQQLFAEAILNMGDLDAFVDDGHSYDLDALADRDFEFQKPPGGGIQSAVVKRLRLSLLGRGKRKVIVQAEPQHDPKAI